MWGLLGFLVLSDTPQPRQRVADLLFPEAEDPLRALRWNLSELRQLLGTAGSVAEGDPLYLTLEPGVLTDLEILLGSSWTQAVRLPGMGRDLLEGFTFDSAPGFELWLTGARAQLRAGAEAVLHEAVVSSLARRDHPRAVDFASRLVSLNPYDENAHVLLIRALRAAGDIDAAHRQLDASIELFREELGVEPSPSFRMAALADRPSQVGDVSRSGVAARLEAGEAAIAAGAWQVGIERLRAAVAGAEAIGEPELQARAHLSLGSSLVHAARGLDQEGAANLHRACGLARETERPLMAATALRELAYVALLRGRYQRCRALLDEAMPLASGDDAEQAWIAAVRGVCETDVANYPEARDWLELAGERAAVGGAIPGAFAAVFLGRWHLLRGELEPARGYFDRSVAMAREEGWAAFVPLPLSLAAEVSLRLGSVDVAKESFEHAFAMSCELGDPCWESLGARGLGMVAASVGDMESAMARLEEAPGLCRRYTDSYLWIEAYALEALCQVAVDTDPRLAWSAIQELESIAARAGMRELLARAMLHRVRLGEHPARQVAVSLIAAIENPKLHADLEAVT